MARILLVDDEKVARAVYGEYLEATGHTVTSTSSLTDAQDLLKSGPFDVVVTDLILPRGDGMQVLQYVKENHPNTEVVVITGLDKVDPAVRAIKSGAAEYLVKPVSPEALQHAIARSLSNRQLLRENESLRQHLALLETGQRIATTLDRERLVTTAVTAFRQMCGADAVILYERAQGQELRLKGSQGVPQEMADATHRLLEQQLATQPLTSAQTLTHLPSPYKKALIYLAVESEATLGVTVLLYLNAIPEGADYAAQFLSKHLGLALRMVGRFAEVEDLAYLDDLTHLFNRRYLELVLNREVENTRKTETPFSLLFLDLDYFKAVNDTHGHPVGSKLLVEVGRVLQSCVREDDVIARYGGDEFVVLLRCSDSGGALKVAERIRRSIESHHFLAREGYSISLTTCIGIASCPEHATDTASMLDYADRAMYRGKRSTRNVVYIASVSHDAPPSARHASLDKQ